jgi:nitrogenase-associated protein
VATVTFFEQPGCRTHDRQRARLEAAGHRVVARDLVSHPWGGAELYAFLVGHPVTEWFDPGSPRVRSGEVDPASLGEDEALCLLLADPALIRHPLVQVGDWREVGLDAAALEAPVPVPPGS